MGPLRRNFDEFSRRWGKGVLINFDLEFHIVVLVHQKAYFVASLIFFYKVSRSLWWQLLSQEWV